MTVTSGASVAQVSVVRGLDLSDSQADSAGSIPVTRSTTKHQVSGLARLSIHACGGRQTGRVPLTCH
jgi:hypothetical protein